MINLGRRQHRMRHQEPHNSCSIAHWPAETSGCQQVLPTDTLGLFSMHVACSAAVQSGSMTSVCWLQHLEQWSSPLK